MKHQGISPYRFKDNPLERAFAEAWDEHNSRGKYSTLQYLMSPDCSGGNPPTECSDRDRLVAATVIQWLGSPVGQDFLMDVLADVLAPHSPETPLPTEPTRKREPAGYLINIGNGWVRLEHISAIAPAPSQEYSQGGEGGVRVLVQGKWVYGSCSMEEVMESTKEAQGIRRTKR